MTSPAIQSAISKYNKAHVVTHDAAEEATDDAQMRLHESECETQLALIRHTEQVLGSNQFLLFDPVKSNVIM
jgi:hypothetical protein